MDNNQPSPRPMHLLHIPPTRSEWSARIQRDKELAAQRRMEARGREMARTTTTTNQQPQ